MIVVDASAMIDLLLWREPMATKIAKHVDNVSECVAPHLLDVEVAQVLRGYVMRADISRARAITALDDLAAFPIAYYPHQLLLARAFALRENMTMYDAMYVVLAEALKIPFITSDAPLARAVRAHTHVKVL